MRARHCGAGDGLDLREGVRGGLEHQPERQDDAAAVGLGKVVDLALEELGIGHDDQFARGRAEAGGLETDPLDGAGGAVIADRVAAAERLVEQNRERGEQVGENALRGQADGDAADPEPGNQRGDVDPEIVEDDDQRNPKQRDRHQHADDAIGIAERGPAGLLADIAVDDPKDQLARPHCRLECGGDRHEDVEDMLWARRHVGVARDGVGGDEDHERQSGA